jgi:hypothetical protein
LRRYRALRQNLVQAEALAEADRQHVEVAQGGLKELLGEGVALGGQVGHEAASL